MGAIVRNVVNDQLLRLSYKDPKNIKRFLRNWGGLEGLSEKGDTVATCILTDLKTVTAIDLDKYHKSDRAEFNKAYRKGKLSHYQYMSIAYVLVLGYTQDELAFVMGVDQSVISKNNLKVEFSRNVPNNLTEIVDTVSKLDGKVDKETLLSLLPFIDNPKEVLEKLEADKERDRQSTDPYSVQNITNDSNNLFPNLNAQNSAQEALNAQGATIPQPEQ